MSLLPLLVIGEILSNTTINHGERIDKRGSERTRERARKRKKNRKNKNTK